MTDEADEESAGAVLDGRTFIAAENSDGGEVGQGTVFRYRQEGGTVWADYAGGGIVRGHLIGTRVGSSLDFRYVHLNEEGSTAVGHCTSRVELLHDGRLRLHEAWRWESRQGSGTSVLDERHS